MDCNMEKLKLNKNETLLLLATKNWILKEEESIKDDKFERFPDNLEETILNDYLDFTRAYAHGIIYVDVEYISLKDIVNFMLRLYTKLEPDNVNNIVMEIASYKYVESTGYGLNKMLKLKYSPTQALFLALFSALQNVQVMKTNENGEYEDIFDLDLSLVVNNFLR